MSETTTSPSPTPLQQLATDAAGVAETAVVTGLGAVAQGSNPVAAVIKAGEAAAAVAIPEAVAALQTQVQRLEAHNALFAAFFQALQPLFPNHIGGLKLPGA